MINDFYKTFETVDYPCYWLGTDEVFWANQFARQGGVPARETVDIHKLMTALLGEQALDRAEPHAELLKTALWMRGINVLPHPEGLLAVGKVLDNLAVEAFSSGLRETVSDIFSAVQALSRRLEHCNLREGDELFCNECLESMQKSEYQLLRLTYNLEFFNRTQHRPPSGKLLEMGSFLDGLCKKAQNAFVKQGIGFSWEIDPLPLPLRADSRALGHAVVNLLRNSLLFTREGNQVKVSLKRVGNRAVLTVKDRGQGIRPEVAAHVFEPFYSVFPHLDSAERPGLGLGLALVRSMARALGGTVAVESVFGEGASLTLALPLAQREECLLKSEPDDYNDYFSDSQSPVYIQLCGFGPLPVM